MKVFACGDIHGDTRLAYKLAKKAEKLDADVIVLTGDITNHTQEFDNLIGPFKELNKKILIIPGNHDDFATTHFLSQKYDLHDLHSKPYASGKIGFFGCGGSNIGLSRMTESGFYDYLSKAHKVVDDCDLKIMVTHNHPKGGTMEKLSNIVIGSEGVTKAIEELKPDILLCSHVHEAEGIEEKLGKTKIINVSKSGKLIEL